MTTPEDQRRTDDALDAIVKLIDRQYSSVRPARDDWGDRCVLPIRSEISVLRSAHKKAVRSSRKQRKRADAAEVALRAEREDQDSWLRGMRATASEPPIEPWLLAAIQARMRDLEGNE